MSFIVIITWLLITSATTLYGAWYVRKYNRPEALFCLYVAFLIISNIAASKIAAFNLGFVTYYAPAATLIFPVTFLLSDVVNERFGRQTTQRMILLAFVSQVAVNIFTILILAAPAAPFWQNQASMNIILGALPRITLASLISFLISENADAYIFSYTKKLTHGKHLWTRTVFSSIPSMTLDSVVFVTLAFYGTSPLLPLMIGQTVIKWLVGLIDVPFMYLNRWIMSKTPTEVLFTNQPLDAKGA